MSFTSVMQLQEYRKVKRALKKHNKERKQSADLSVNETSPNKRSGDRDDSSQDESSVYGSCGYFIRFSEKSSPFENLYDQRMVEEDILSGIADETSCYYSEESSDNDNESIPAFQNTDQSKIPINNSSLNLLRIIGRYLQMCRLLYAISAHIIHSMTELIDCYFYSVYELFSKDLPVRAKLYIRMNCKITWDEFQAKLVLIIVSGRHYRTLSMNWRILNSFMHYLSE